MALPALLLPMLQPILNAVIDRIPDPKAKAQAEADAAKHLLDLMTNQNLQQLEVNKAEAANGSAFASGWRPAIGYVCAAALALTYIVAPLVSWVAAAGGWDVPALPTMDGALWELMFGMLGLSGLRTFEKVAKR